MVAPHKPCAPKVMRDVIETQREKWLDYLNHSSNPIAKTLLQSPGDAYYGLNHNIEPDFWNAISTSDGRKRLSVGIYKHFQENGRPDLAQIERNKGWYGIQTTELLNDFMNSYPLQSADSEPVPKLNISGKAASVIAAIVLTIGMAFAASQNGPASASEAPPRAIPTVEETAPPVIDEDFLIGEWICQGNTRWHRPNEERTEWSAQLVFHRNGTLEMLPRQGRGWTIATGGPWGRGAHAPQRTVEGTFSWSLSNSNDEVILTTEPHSFRGADLRNLTRDMQNDGVFRSRVTRLDPAFTGGSEMRFENSRLIWFEFCERLR